MDPNVKTKHPGVLMVLTICPLSVTFHSLVHPPSIHQHLNLMQPDKTPNQHATALTASSLNQQIPGTMTPCSEILCNKRLSRAKACSMHPSI
jgi:hypothetical protein